MAEADSSQRLFQPRFSLLSLLLLTTVVACIVQIVLLYQKLTPLQTEVRQLRNEAGYLTVEDKTSIHAIELHTESPLVHRWRVWVPDGTGVLSLGSLIGEIPAKDSYEELTGELGVELQKGHEEIVSVRIYRDIDEKWKKECAIGNHKVWKVLSSEEVSTLQAKAGRIESLPRREMLVGKSGEPLILLRQRNSDGNMVPQSSANGPGILIWLKIVPVPDPAGRIVERPDP